MKENRIENGKKCLQNNEVNERRYWEKKRYKNWEDLLLDLLTYAKKSRKTKISKETIHLQLDIR